MESEIPREVFHVASVRCDHELLSTLEYEMDKLDKLVSNLDPITAG
jgi:hypothetical protein